MTVVPGWLTPSNLQAAPAPSPAPNPNVIDVDDIQGDILVGLQKNAEIFAFFTITNVPMFKSLLRREVAKRITSTRLTIAREFQLRDAADKPGTAQPAALPITGVNLAFTSAGIGKLVPGGSDLGDTAFAATPQVQASALQDPADGNQAPIWLPKFLNNAIDGVFLLTGGTSAVVTAELALLTNLLQGAVTFIEPEIGAVRPDEHRGHEHFGFADGISQPAVIGMPETPFPGQRSVNAGRFVFGYPDAPQPKFPWMVNGSFMVFRRLKQLVPEFDKVVEDESNRHDMDSEVLGARMMGRWKSGAPVVSTPLQDDIPIGEDPRKNNDFDFASDKDQRACPYGAHIRKMNPRTDLSDDQSAVDARRIIRAGIPFGPEVSDAERASGTTSQDRGLLFVCYQTSIDNQFEFLQRSWANNTGFIFGKVRPDEVGASVLVGHDPIIGQAPGDRSRQTDEAFANFPAGDRRSEFKQTHDTVVPQGGAYFFMPSFTAIINDLAT